MGVRPMRGEVSLRFRPFVRFEAAHWVALFLGYHISTTAVIR